jgi:hypothetical protein
MNASGCAVEQSRWAWLPHSTKHRALMLFQDVIGLYLSILEEFKATQDWCGWNIVVEQAWWRWVLFGCQGLSSPAVVLG